MDLLGLSPRRYAAMEQQLQASGGDPGTIFWTLASRDQMARVITYSVPHRFHHWSFGKRYLELLQSPGRLYEFVVWAPGAAEAYIDATLDTAEVEMIVAHVLGHASFFNQNYWYRREPPLSVLDWTADAEWVDSKTDDMHEEVRQYTQQFGKETVPVSVTRHTTSSLTLEVFPHWPLLSVYSALDLLLGLEDATSPPWTRNPLASEVSETPSQGSTTFWRIWHGLDPMHEDPKPVNDSALDQLGRVSWDCVDVGDIVEHTARSPLVREAMTWLRREWDYFWVMKATKLSNEGWATYTHQRLTQTPSSEKAAWMQSRLRTGVELPNETNPYWLGSALFHLLEEDGENPQTWMERGDDHLLLTMGLTPERVQRLQLFPVQIDPKFDKYPAYWAILHDRARMDQVGERLALWWQAAMHGGMGTPQLIWTGPRAITVPGVWGQALYGGQKPPPMLVDVWWFIGLATLLGRSLTVTFEGEFLQSRIFDTIKGLGRS